MSALLERDARPARKGDACETPWPLYRALDREFAFTVDAAARAHNTKAARFFPDGLAASWEGERVFCNPPWSDIAPWARKAAERAADVAVLLVPVRTDRPWWHGWGRHADEIRWIEGRVNYEGMGSRAREPSVILVFRRGCPIGSHKIAGCPGAMCDCSSPPHCLVCDTERDGRNVR